MHVFVWAGRLPTPCEPLFAHQPGATCCSRPTDCRYDGYRLTYLGYDYLAIKALVNRGAIAGVGRQVGGGLPHL